MNNGLPSNGADLKHNQITVETSFWLMPTLKNCLISTYWLCLSNRVHNKKLLRYAKCNLNKCTSVHTSHTLKSGLSSLRIAIIHAFLNSVFFTDGMWWKLQSLWILAFPLQFGTQQNSSLFFTWSAAMLMIKMPSLASFSLSWPRVNEYMNNFFENGLLRSLSMVWDPDLYQDTLKIQWQDKGLSFGKLVG